MSAFCQGWVWWIFVFPSRKGWVLRSWELFSFVVSLLFSFTLLYYFSWNNLDSLSLFSCWPKVWKEKRKQANCLWWFQCCLKTLILILSCDIISLQWNRVPKSTWWFCGFGEGERVILFIYLCIAFYLVFVSWFIAGKQVGLKLITGRIKHVK